MHVGGWKIDVNTDPVTGKCTQSEYFHGNEIMKVKEEQTYLGDLLSAGSTILKRMLEF